MEKFTTIIKPLFNPITGTPFVLGPQGPYNNSTEALDNLLKFYNGPLHIPNGQPVVIEGKPYYYYDGSFKDITNENVPFSFIYDLGDVNRTGDAEEAAKNPNISGNNNINIIRYTVNKDKKSGLILQQVGSNITIQVLFWDANMYMRHIHFTDNNRTAIDTYYNTDWWQTGATHIKYDPNTGKIGLCYMDQTIMNEYHTATILLGSNLHYNTAKTINIALDKGLMHDERGISVRTHYGFNVHNDGIDIGPIHVNNTGDSRVDKANNCVIIPDLDGLELKISTGLNVDDEGFLYVNYDKLAEALYTRIANIAAAKATETE